MNIIKLHDIVMPNEYRMAKLFNEQLKGRYAYWIQMRYIFPLDSLSYSEYIHYEQLDAIHFLSDEIKPHIDIYSEECCMIDFVNLYIDISTTEEANSTYKFAMDNSYVPDADIDINKLRQFRSWLASELLNHNAFYGESNAYSTEVVHMLEYYKNNKYNDVVKYLDKFGVKGKISTTPITGSCGCCNTVSIPLSFDASLCDAKTIYTDNIHAFMVQTFEDPNFWINTNTQLIGIFKKYIDNILKVGFVIKAANGSRFIECSCNTNNSMSQNDVYLKELSTALGYIIDNDVKGHINFIHTALYNWAEYLYEYMYWPIN